MANELVLTHVYSPALVAELFGEALELYGYRPIHPRDGPARGWERDQVFSILTASTEVRPGMARMFIGSTMFEASRRGAGSVIRVAAAAGRPPEAEALFLHEALAEAEKARITFYDKQFPARGLE